MFRSRNFDRVFYPMLSRRAAGPAAFQASIALLAFLPMLGCSTNTSSNNESAGSSGKSFVQPSEELSPADIVQIQVESLQNLKSDGIPQAYLFSASRNRTFADSSLKHFSVSLNSEEYQPLQVGENLSYSPMDLNDSTAQQIVTVTTPDGFTHFYLFELTLQKSGDFRGCWMTDSVTHSPFQLPPNS